MVKNKNATIWMIILVFVVIIVYSNIFNPPSTKNEIVHDCFYVLNEDPTEPDFTIDCADINGTVVCGLDSCSYPRIPRIVNISKI